MLRRMSRLILLSLIAVLLSACPVEPEPEDEPTPEPAPERETLVGDMTWTVDFDEEAEANGAVDCAYTRHYDGVEDRSLPWLCGECGIIFRADVSMVEGLDDCFSQVTTAPVNPLEYLGFEDGAYHRGGSGPMTLQGSADEEGDTLTTSHLVEDVPAPVGGTLSFTIDGVLTLGGEDGDPNHGVVPPESYACGWPISDEPEYGGDYTLSVGGALPDALLGDVCEDWVRLHDFAGRYLVIDISALDCPPCQAMAAAEPAFIEAMADEGIEVEVVTLMAPSLSNTAGTPTTSQLQQWVDSYDFHSPVLGDRVWGLSVAQPLLADDFGYPASLIVAPDLTLIDTRVGFGGFEAFADIIRDDAAR
jgi:hypothetical protein